MKRHGNVTTIAGGQNGWRDRVTRTRDGLRRRQVRGRISVGTSQGSLGERKVRAIARESPREGPQNHACDCASLSVPLVSEVVIGSGKFVWRPITEIFVSNDQAIVSENAIGKKSVDRHLGPLRHLTPVIGRQQTSLSTHGTPCPSPLT